MNHSPNFFPLTVFGVVAVLFAGVGQGRGADAASESSASASTNATIPQAVFVYEIQGGKDPFFPNSRRRATPNSPGPAFSEGTGTPALALKGISVGKQRRLALINNLTLAEGEKGSVRIGTQTVSVHCLEIRKQSVLVALDGSSAPTELRLREL
jgi:hypothetical protein